MKWRIHATTRLSIELRLHIRPQDRAKSRFYWVKVSVRVVYSGWPFLNKKAVKHHRFDAASVMQLSWANMAMRQEANWMRNLLVAVKHGHGLTIACCASFVKAIYMRKRAKFWEILRYMVQKVSSWEAAKVPKVMNCEKWIANAWLLDTS